MQNPAHEKFHELMENAVINSDIGIMIIDRDLKVVVWNNWLARTSHISSEEAVGCLLPDVFSAIGETRIFSAIDEALSSGRSAFFSQSLNPPSFPLKDFGNVSDDTSYMDQTIIIKPIYNAGGEVFCLIQIMDVSKIVLRERALRERSIKLTELANELKVANKNLESFSYSVSHDLRAPLRAMSGFSQALIEDCGEQLDDTGRDYLERINAASLHMGRLIDDLLSLSWVSRCELRRERVNLSELVLEIGEKYKEANPGRDIKLNVEADLFEDADEGLVCVILDNIIGNAVKFTNKKNHAQLDFGLKKGEGKRTYFLQDNGVGFDMAYVEKIFQPFERLHDANEYEGTGIGLATVSRSIHRLGGKVWAQSEIGQGTGLFFTLSPNGEKEERREIYRM